MVKNWMRELLIIIVWSFLFSSLPTWAQDASDKVAHLIGQLESEDPKQRASAADRLGYCGDSRAVAPLIELLRDEDKGVRWQAAKALGKIGDPTAIEPLKKVMSDEDGNVRWWVQWALQQLGGQIPRNEDKEVEVAPTEPLPDSLKYKQALELARQRAGDRKCPVELTNMEVGEAKERLEIEKSVGGQSAMIPHEKVIEGAVLVTIELVNKTGKSIRDYKVLCYLYDEAGSYLNSFQCRTTLTDIKPGETVNESWLVEAEAAAKAIVEFLYITFEDGSRWDSGIKTSRFKVNIGAI